MTQSAGVNVGPRMKPGTQHQVTTVDDLIDLLMHTEACKLCWQQSPQAESHRAARLAVLLMSP